MGLSKEPSFFETYNETVTVGITAVKQNRGGLVQSS